MFLSLRGTSKRFSPAEDTPKSEVEKEVPGSHQQRKANKTPCFQETALLVKISKKMPMKISSWRSKKKHTHTCNLIPKGNHGNDEMDKKKGPSTILTPRKTGGKTVVV